MLTLMLFLAPFVVLVVSVALLVRDLSSGSATISGQSFKRVGNPPAYWSIMLLYLAIAVFASFTAYKFRQNGTQCPIFVERCTYQIDLKSA
jgi:ABC-type spermidine/putrescine transport system permease subunit I